MKLYYTPGACSLAPHIVAAEAGIPIDLVKVDLHARKTEDGRDYTTINPRGYVPALDIGDGEPLTEASIIVQHLADSKPEAGLIPPVGSRERLRVQQWLAFIATELHKGFGPLWNPALPAEVKEATVARLKTRIADVETRLAGRSFLAGDHFGVADAYLFTILGWAKLLHVDLSPYPNVVAYLGRVGSRPGVQAALKAEGLLG
ncbi:glutathione transferase GstA [Alsobacter sp. R-9]